ncbi:MAG TPA: 30S ribosome-binding factor RbfA [Microthrixaceae bacterium]|nr:30S ribosome-binding factor RbfA [Microthrixaceae bacterium]
MGMARRRRTAARRATRQYSRTDRLGELVREVVASELERIGDERLELVTITDATVDGSLEHADVFWSALQAEDDGRLDEVVEALEEQRWKVQQVVNREVRARKTPQISFRHDDVLRSALRVDQILRDIEPGATGAPEPDGGSDGEPDGDPDDGS